MPTCPPPVEGLPDKVDYRALTARMQLCGKDGPLSNPAQAKGDTPLDYLEVERRLRMSCGRPTFVDATDQ